MKKVWIIRNGQKETTHFHENKEELKKVRNQLNKEVSLVAPVREKDMDDKAYAKLLAQFQQTMPFKITKGPDHPRI